MTDAERQRKHAVRKRERGLVPVTVWLPATEGVAVEFKRAAQIVVERPGWRLGRVVDDKGRVRGLD
jgi:hypothetical protein